MPSKLLSLVADEPWTPLKRKWMNPRKEGVETTAIMPRIRSSKKASTAPNLLRWPRGSHTCRIIGKRECPCSMEHRLQYALETKA
mmetsp:Transcript_72023/g.171949  ORF Transcript_72023/g.171949 Transcript_72023/m.171949 type:complete len:85 (-) Transcript_72023:9-263(-)